MRKWLAPALAFFVPFAVYSPTLLGTFYYDDNVIFLGHQVQVLAANPFMVFDQSTHYLPGAPRSIHVFFLLIIYRIFGPSPLPYHAFNLLIHSATVLLLFLFLRRILLALSTAGDNDAGKAVQTPALIGALLFGLHPVHVENITFVTLGGTDIFYALWALLSLNLYIAGRDRGMRSWPGWVWIALSAGAYYLSLISKESAVSFVVIYPLTEFLLGRRGYLWALPHASVLMLFKRDILFKAAPAVIEQAAGQAAVQTAGGAAATAGMPEVLKSLGFFAKSIFFPYPHQPFIKEFGSAGLLYAAAVVAVLAVVIALVTRKRIPAYAGLWFLAVSAPYHFVPFSTTNVAVTAERYIYAPSVALAILGAWIVGEALAAGWAKRKVLAVAAAVLVIFSVMGIGYFNMAWRSEEAFWRYAVRTNPEYVSGYVSLSSEMLNKGDAEQAKQLLAEGLGKPKGMPAEYAQAAYGLGRIHLREGNAARAESYYLLSLQHSPYEFSYIELGFLYLNSKNLGRSRWAFENALRFPQRSPRALIGLALGYGMEGDFERARPYASEAYQRSRDQRVKAAASEILKGRNPL